MGRPRTPINTFGSIHVKRLDPGKYAAEARYRNEAGKSVRMLRTASTEAKAESRLREALRDAIASGLPDGRLRVQSSISELAEAWLSFSEDSGKAAGSLRQYRSVLTTHILPALGDLHIGYLTTGKAQRFLAGINGDGSARNAKRVLSSMFSFAVAEDVLKSNPILGTRGRKAVRKVGLRSVPLAELSEFRQVLRSDRGLLEFDVADLLILLSWTGLRIGEACALRWQDVGPDWVDVNATTVRLKGVGIVRQKFPKTESSNRRISIAPEAGELLEARSRGRERDPIFPALHGKWRDGDEVQRRLRQRAEVLGYPEITTHWFRRTVASLLDDAGLSARDIADYLGHSNPSVTQDTYMQRGTESLRAAQVLSQFGE